MNMHLLFEILGVPAHMHTPSVWVVPFSWVRLWLTDLSWLPLKWTQSAQRFSRRLLCFWFYVNTFSHTHCFLMDWSLSARPLLKWARSVRTPVYSTGLCSLDSIMLGLGTEIAPTCIGSWSEGIVSFVRVAFGVIRLFGAWLDFGGLWLGWVRSSLFCFVLFWDTLDRHLTCGNGNECGAALLKLVVQCGTLRCACRIGMTVYDLFNYSIFRSVVACGWGGDAVFF